MSRQPSTPATEASVSHRLTIDNDICLSSGRCVADLPAVFRFDDDELAELIPGVEEPADMGVLLAVVRNCPAGAIALRDEDGSEVEA